LIDMYQDSKSLFQREGNFEVTFKF
jgi:hypothetical protein